MASVTRTALSCNKCLKGTMHPDPLDGDLICINCGYILIVAVALSAGIPTSPKRKSERANVAPEYYLTPFYQE